MMALIPSMALAGADDWLWEKSAEPIKLDTTKTVIVCTARGCFTVIVSGQ